MRAMILAAGRGQRLGDLTMTTPKPLLKVNGHYLIEYAIANVRRAGIQEIVINISYLAEQIKMVLGDGRNYGVSIIYSEEKERLETGGGILKALPMLGKEPFLVVSCDIITNYPLQQLLHFPETSLAHLILVNNPIYHPQGDFGLQGNKVDPSASPTYTFANLGIYRPELFNGHQMGHFRLAQVLKPAIISSLITGELYEGIWYNIGTIEDLQAVNKTHLQLERPNPFISKDSPISSV